MQTPACTSDNEPALVSLPDALRNFHRHLPLAGDPPNALLSLSDDLLTYLMAAIRNTPRSPPDLSPDDWHNFLTLLRPHWIFPLITFHLRAWPEECRPPQEIMEYLNRIFLMAAARNLLAGRQIQAVTDALKDAGIPVILLKGHALARTVYPDPALRQSSDIDLLVQPEDVPGCEPVFARLGYACPIHIYGAAPLEHHHQTFVPSGKGIPIELHWVTDHGYRMFPPDWLRDAFDRKIPVAAGDLSCYTLNPVDHLSFLAFHHIFQHQSLRLDWIGDIAQLMKHLAVSNDWDRLRSTCGENHIRIPMELALTAGDLWLAGAIPAEYRDFSSWPVPSVREQHLWKHATARPDSLYSTLYLGFQGMPSYREKLGYCGRFILPPLELMRPYRKSESAL
ncbi:MAG: nucleotidyltransferase family protein, partial [Deltaproteobacteria bacterium]|nr:nucleotidyltransferase family protein [Deltaproteobacteria bacterium]